MVRHLRPRLGTADLSIARAHPRVGNPQATPRQRGRPWQRRRADWLSEHPLCAHCKAEGRVRAGSEVDHVVPLADGGADDEANLQTLCPEHHAAKTAREAAARAGRGGG